MEVSRRVGSLFRVRREGRADNPDETAEIHEVSRGCILLIGVSCEKENKNHPG